jgi:hypothetical protein
MGMVKMKGQIFIITSVLILIALLIVRINTQTTEIKTDETFYEDFSNLKNELINTIDFSIMTDTTNLENNLIDFIGFSKSVFQKRGYNEDVTYLITVNGDNRIIYLNVSLNSSKSYLKENLIINRTVYT